MAAPTPEPFPEPTAVRDRAVDVARLGALLVVVFGHCVLLLATIDSGGVHIANLIGAVPAVAPLTWVAQVMPLFFVAGGAAGSYSYRSEKTWGSWLFVRAQRLCRPAFFYLAAWSAGLLAVRLTLGEESAAGLGGESVALLWFLGVYLVTLAFVPALTRLRSVRGVATVLGCLIVAAAVMDALRFDTGDPGAGAPNFVIVWLIPVVIGVAYARRLLGPRLAAAIGSSALAAQIALAVFGPYDVSLVVTGAERVSNVAPPTALLALHCTWMACAFVVLAPRVARWAGRSRLWPAVVAGNRGAMTLYLWHIPAIAITAFGLHAVGLDAYDVAAPDFWWLLALRAVVFTPVMLVLLVVLAPLEHRRLPWWDGPVRAGGSRASAAGVLICVAGVALVLLARSGLDAPAGWTALGVFLAAGGAARLVASTPSGVTARKAPG
ncbi:acetyltransferase, fucose-4-O-acetylase [Mycolicibacterium chubuense NBB4]|uniref:Acetyltransferase, fucose-4-O-acetylase n=1 Tax=Mycolicibacterium chubuense (strain NBB4) TaxID=710421 RepID=I4BJK5_MYCCN|nr:acyltransferase [Mycolicibacterium chubuense]AFM17462.1 acetyltransferase, fucose-4-O-acetylase [Mycolicibacterium chubuense NBB4]